MAKYKESWSLKTTWLLILTISSGSTQITLRFDNSLEGHQTLWKLLYSWLQLITGKGYRWNQPREEGVQEKGQMQGLHCPLPWVSRMGYTLVAMCNSAHEYCQQGSPLELWCPECLLGLHHIGMINGLIGHVVNFNLQLHWYNVTPKPSPWITLLVFLKDMASPHPKIIRMWPGPTLTHIVRLSSMTHGPQADKDNPTRHNIPRIQRLPPRSWGAEARPCLWARSNSSWHMGTRFAHWYWGANGPRLF